MKQRELEQRLQDLFDGRLAEEDLAELEEELRSNPAAKETYRDYVHLQNALQLRAEGVDLLNVVPMDRVIARRQRRHLRNALFAAAAVLAVLGVISALVMIDQPQPPRLAATVAADTLWLVDGEQQETGTRSGSVPAGSTVQVLSGTVALSLQSGSRLLLQGPAKAHFPDLASPDLKRGWLWIDSGDSADSFEVRTPDLLVRNIGTRFGVFVPSEGPAEVHLIEGAVEVVGKGSREKFIDLNPDERGLAIAANGEFSGRTLARDPFPDLAELMAAPANFPTTVMSQNPSGYWRLDEGEGQTMPNEVQAGIGGRLHKDVTTRVPGPSGEDQLQGLGDENLALRLSGAGQGVPLSLGHAPVHRGILFEDDFNGKGPLHGRTPNTTTGRTKWVAVTSPSKFNADGTFEGRGEKASPRRGGSATLGFTPVNGVVYTLEASIRNLSARGYYTAVGFANGQSSKGSKDSRFLKGFVAGRAWMLLRDAGRASASSAYLGTTGSTGGMADGQPFASHSDENSTDLDLRIILDTSQGPGRWTATWLAKHPTEQTFSVVRPTATLLNESISSVGFAVGGNGASGTIESFSLRADRKETSASSSPLRELPANVARKEGTLSFWFRPDAKRQRLETLWSAGENILDDAIHAHIGPGGQVGLFMENGRYDVLITSEEPTARGQWHHFVASWSPSSVDLYLNGLRVASDTEYREMLQGTLHELRFGCGPAGAKKGAPFTGDIDEIALWDRALTPTEVTHQYQSALGKSPEP